MHDGVSVNVRNEEMKCHQRKSFDGLDSNFSTLCNVLLGNCAHGNKTTNQRVSEWVSVTRLVTIFLKEIAQIHVGSLRKCKENITFKAKSAVTTFWATLELLWLPFIPTSGHTGLGYSDSWDQCDQKARLFCNIRPSTIV